jgi:hypothetical protein
MGAEIFYTESTGDTVDHAFWRAVRHANDYYGRSGYTGTIAEKNSYVEIKCPKNIKPMDYANKLIDENDERIEDKWGDAGAIKLGKEKWLFFGWASS